METAQTSPIPTGPLLPTQWIALCAQRLSVRWHSVDPEQLEEVAVDIWKDAHFRAMSPVEAAAIWLAPIGSTTEG